LKPCYLLGLLLLLDVYGCKNTPKAYHRILTDDYHKALSILDQNSDSAFYYFNKTTSISKDSLEIAMAFNYMAIIQADAGDYFGSQESLLNSIRLLNEQNEQDLNCYVSDYNELGSNSSILKNYDEAILYFNLALKLVKTEAYKTITLNNEALAYERKGSYDTAIVIYQSILDSSKQNKKEYARILSNLAKTRYLKDSSFQAAPYLWKALQIRKSEGDEWGLNASYAHLSDYYKDSHPDSALQFADSMYSVASHLNSPDDQLEALQKLIYLSPGNEAKSYFLRYRFLNDSLQTARNAAKNQFALIRYEAQKSKADNLRLQKDIIIQRAIIFFTCILLILGIYSYIKRRQRIKLQAQNAIRQSKLQTSQKVHDVVANGIYHIMIEIEYQEELEKNILLDKLEDLYEQSRNISYDIPKAQPSGFQLQLSELLTSFANEAIKVSVVGNQEEIWNGIKNETRAELKLLLQELMINMKKHSSAHNVVVKFETKGDKLKIEYIDDGIGLPVNFRPGNGLNNTENRIREIGGEIIFESSPLKGLTIQVIIPTT
jgi:tetratricopeptide (TPR) repeat protein